MLDKPPRSVAAMGRMMFWRNRVLSQPFRSSSMDSSVMSNLMFRFLFSFVVMACFLSVKGGDVVPRDQVLAGHPGTLGGRDHSGLIGAIKNSSNRMSAPI